MCTIYFLKCIIAELLYSYVFNVFSVCTLCDNYNFLSVLILRYKANIRDVKIVNTYDQYTFKEMLLHITTRWKILLLYLWLAMSNILMFHILEDYKYYNSQIEMNRVCVIGILLYE